MSGRNQRGGTSPRQYRGIRMRRCGKWVSEIREPSTRTRIWFGSFGTAEEAARAYDAALVCIRGLSSQVNFPDEAPTIPRGTPGGYTAREIQAAAAAWAAASVGRPFSYSDFMSQRQYRGTRMRRCGKWVSEIREPSTRTRIWLGSFATAEEAAHAYDAALVCIGGLNAQVNFPDEAPTIPTGTPGGYTAREMQAAAAAWAAASVGRPFSYSDFMSERQYRGTCMRRCGKWVSEIREPSTRTRIWLGSFGTAEEAARAYDAALVCIAGLNARVNFPDKAPTIPRGTPGAYTTREIQAAAAAWAAASVGRPFSYSDFMSRKAADSQDGQGREDDTYTEPAQAAQPAPSNSTGSYNSWSNAGQFDDPYEREWVNRICNPPHPEDDSDDDNDSSVVASLWSY